MKVFHDPRQSVQENDSFSPSASKPALAVQSWSRLGIPFEIRSFSPLSMDDLALAHDRRYVEEILSCKEPNGFGNRSQTVADSLPWVCGSMAESARCAFETGETCFSPTSGAHHAGYNFGGGFCTFNSLIMAAQMAHTAGAETVAIVDMDCHWGNGTQDIMDRLKLGDWLRHYSFGRQSLRPASSDDLWPFYGAGPNGSDVDPSVDAWLRNLTDRMQCVMSGVDLVIFNAGVDSHADDPLGGYLTTEDMARRDDIVLRTAFELGIPVALALAGGYQKEANGSINAVLRLHDTTFETAARYDRVGWSR